MKWLDYRPQNEFEDLAIRLAFSIIAVAGAFLLFVAMVSLTGCASAPDIITRTEQVKVPVAVRVYCDATETPLPLPALPIAKLALDTKPAETVRAYAESVALLKSAVKERDLTLKECAKP